MMLCGIIRGVVDTEHDGDVFVFGRRRNDDLLNGTAQMLRGACLIHETAGGLDDDLSANRTPVDESGVFLSKYLDAALADHDGVAIHGDGLGVRAEQRVVLRHVGESRGVGEVVDGDEFDLRIIQSGADDVAANAAEAVDTNFNGHVAGDSPSGFTLMRGVKDQDIKRSLRLSYFAVKPRCFSRPSIAGGAPRQVS